jgi:hypothetical protein
MTVPAACRDAVFLVLDKSVRGVEGDGWTRTTFPEPDGRVMIAVYRHASR